MIKRLLVAAAFAASVSATTQVPDAARHVGPPKGTPLQGEVLERRTNEVAALLRCPVCQGLAVADSPAEMAVNMKRQVHELLARGYTEQQILTYFEQSYGEFVLQKPKFEGVNALVWLLPPAALIVGAVIVFMKMRSLQRGQPPPPPPAAEDPYVSRVRNLVSGGKS